MASRFLEADDPQGSKIVRTQGHHQNQGCSAKLDSVKH